ncbi:MAG: T9SS type A sorting domain-containing protein [Bacteroidales bacterium]|jgi:hypothetical protein|nr:T9SS type A sorting domain-containing protein [Bacteroidales bacterium]
MVQPVVRISLLPFLLNQSDDIIKTIIINDSKGSIVSAVSGINANTYTVNLSNFAKGVYFAKIQTVLDIQVKKFIVN